MGLSFYFRTTICVSRSHNVLSAFLNPWMLAGLAGLLLPVIAHLLSRKKYDLVEWGAMQFLELDPSAKRKIRLEELLLLLVRMGLVALFAVALARPWIGSHWLGQYVSTQPRDVVLIVDGSYSMDWDGQRNGSTPQVRSRQLAREFLNELRPGDAIQVIDAREQPQVVLPELTRDPYRVKEALNDLPAPSGSADLVAALRKGIQVLASGTNLQREVVLFTDLQASSFKADDAGVWARLDDILDQSSIVPRIWVIDAANGELGQGANYAIERVKVSRELAITGIPVKIRSQVRSFSGEEATQRKVYLEIDQVRLNDQTIQVKIPPKGETAVDFEYRFDTPGSHLVSIVIEDDALPGDNRADAVITVTQSLSVLLVDSDDKLDPTKRETFFLNAALMATGDQHPWIQPTVISPEELTLDRLNSVSLVVISNVATLNPSSIEALQKFAASGHAVLFSLGDKIDRDHYRTALYLGGKGVFPCLLESVAIDDGNEKRGVRIASNSLELPWLQPFRADRGGTLGDARWSSWWKITMKSDRDKKNETATRTGNGERNEPLDSTSPATEETTFGSPIVEARLTTGDPLLVTRRYGYGTTAVLTSSIDADWSTLPAKQDYVPFLYELLFSLATPTASRNVGVDSPLILSVSKDLKADDFHFVNPVNKSYPAEKFDDPFQPTVRLRSTRVPGIYRFLRKVPKANEVNRPEYFVVNFDRSESDVTPLDEAQREQLSSDDRLTFVNDLPDLRKNMFAESSRTEIWWLLLYVFVGSLALETWMTRRMVQGGYGT